MYFLFSLFPNVTSSLLHIHMGDSPTVTEKQIVAPVWGLRNSTMLVATSSYLKVDSPLSKHSRRIQEAAATPPLSHCFYLHFLYQLLS